MGGDYRSKLADERDWLLSRIVSKPDITLFELRAELRERGVTVGYGAIWRFFAREGISFKKKACCRWSRSGLISRTGAQSGNAIRGGLTQHGWFLSTRHGPKPTWPAPMAAAAGDKNCTVKNRMATG